MDDIGGRVKAAREIKGWSMSRLAQEAGVSKGYLSQLEASPQANPSLDILKRIADALETTVGHLIGASVAVAPVRPQPAMDSGLGDFLQERRRRGNPVPDHDVQLLLQLQWRGGTRGDRPTSKEDWERFYDHVLPMWESSTGRKDGT